MEKLEQKFNISITLGTVIKTLIVLVAAFLLYKMLDLVLVVLIAVVIASAIEPLIKWFGRHRIQRIFAVILTYLVITLFVLGLLYFFLPPVLDEASNLLSEAPQYLDTISLWNPLNDSKLVEGGQIADTLSRGLDGGKQIITDLSNGNVGSSMLGDLVAQFRNLNLGTSDSMINIVSSIFGGAFSFVLIIVLSFYLAVQEGGVERFLRIITPLKDEAYIINLWKRSQRKIGYWMQGQLLLGVVVGVLVYLGLVIMGVKNALVLAVIAGILEVIPVFGPILSAIPAILFGFASGGLTTALLVLGLFVIVQQFENHLIYPLVVKKVIGVSPILVILAMIVGGKLAGFLGLVLSVPVTSVLLEYIDDKQKDRAETEGSLTHTVA